MVRKSAPALCEYWLGCMLAILDLSHNSFAYSEDIISVVMEAKA